MIAEPLDAIPLGIFFAVSTALALLALEAGYQIGRWRHTHAEGEKDAPIGAMVGAILGLLAFMLAFFLSCIPFRFSPYDDSNEANAIGATYLRVCCRNRSGRKQPTAQEYVDVRIRGVQEGRLRKRFNDRKNFTRIWTQAIAAADKNANSIAAGVFIRSLNEMIDLHATRLLIGVRSRIPITIWVGLFTLALVGMASMGYQAGLSATRRSPAMLFLAISFAGVLFLIVDLDRPHEGLLRVGQQAMIDVQRTMQPSQK
jgi:hypothetical protein